MQKCIVGKKIGMTQLFDENGTVIPVTVIEAGPCVVTQKKTIENDGYEAVQIGYGNIADKNLSKPRKGHFEKADLPPKRHLKEFRLEDASTLELGDVIKPDVFEAGELVDVTGTSKGKGFSGSVKRHGKKIEHMSHGGKKQHRKPGSIGMAATPGKVLKGGVQAGHMGAETVTVQNLTVVKVDADNNLIALRGAVPGPKGGIVSITDAVKA